MIVKSNNENVYSRIIGAINKMSTNSNDAVFAFTLISLPIEINVNDSIENLASEYTDAIIYTNGKGIKIEGSIAKIEEIFSKYGIINILKHELEHILLKHIERTETFQTWFKDYPKETIQQITNISGDYIINKDLGIKDDNFVTGKYIERFFGINESELYKKSMEEIAAMLIKKNAPMKTMDILNALKNALKSDGFGGGSSFNHIKDFKSGEFDKFLGKQTKKFGFDFDKYMVDVIKRAITTCGVGQSGIWKQLEEIYGKPLVDWNNVLTEELRRYKTRDIADNGENVINRRYYVLSRYADIPIMFQKHKKTFKNGIIAIDTSGSISDETYRHEIAETIKLIKGEGIDWKIILFDDGIVKDKDGNNVVFNTRNVYFEDLITKLLNRTYGGTNISEVLDYANNEKAKFLILISDMNFSYNIPKYDTFRKIFVSTNRKDQTPRKVEAICDKLIYFKPY